MLYKTASRSFPLHPSHTLCSCLLLSTIPTTTRKYRFFLGILLFLPWITWEAKTSNCTGLTKRLSGGSRLNEIHEHLHPTDPIRDATANDLMLHHRVIHPDSPLQRLLLHTQVARSPRSPNDLPGPRTSQVYQHALPLKARSPIGSTGLKNIFKLPEERKRTKNAPCAFSIFVQGSGFSHPLCLARP